MHPYNRVSVASALNNRTLNLHGALDQWKSSRENLLMHAHAALLRWLIFCVSSPSSLTKAAQVSELGGLSVLLPCCYDDQWWWRRSPFLRLFLPREILQTKRNRGKHNKNIGANSKRDRYSSRRKSHGFSITLQYQTAEFTRPPMMPPFAAAGSSPVLQTPRERRLVQWLFRRCLPRRLLEAK